jgi:hypothetical protein
LENASCGDGCGFRWLNLVTQIAMELPMGESDPYWKLRPAAPTPADEVCQCATLQSAMLRDALGPNPIYCVVCNGEVPPERLGFDEQLADELASWRCVFRSLYVLWLDSGEYEVWAAEKLSDPIGQVNMTGRSLVSRLNQYVRAYYWWFEDTGADGYAPPRQCPICHHDLADVEGREFGKCDNCSVLV